MKASFVDLRKKSSEVMRALLRREAVTILYRGSPLAVMRPIADKPQGPPVKAENCPAFGIWADREDLTDVRAHVRKLRKGRFNDR